jgi:hypothetical protein
MKKHQTDFASNDTVYFAIAMVICFSSLCIAAGALSPTDDMFSCAAKKNLSKQPAFNASNLSANHFGIPAGNDEIQKVWTTNTMATSRTYYKSQKAVTARIPRNGLFRSHCP